MSLFTIGLYLLTTLAGQPPQDPAMQPLRVGEVASTLVESPHPYPNGGAGAPTVVLREIREAGATYMVVHFSRFELAAGDELMVRDPQSTAVHRYADRGRMGGEPFWSFSVPGDTLVIELQSHHRGSYGYQIDRYEHGFAPIFPPVTTRSVCGIDDKRNTRCYETLYPTQYQRSRPVARIRFCGSLCTGSIISCDNHFITNNHCRDTGCGLSGYEVWFDYETPTCSGGTATPVVAGFATDVRNNSTLDYWLVTLDTDAAATYGSLQLDARQPLQDEVIYIPQHPSGATKKLAILSDMNAGNVCRVDDTNRDGNGSDTDAGYFCDTAGGSSGSPVLSEQSHRVLLLHHFGIGSDPCVGNAMNGGVRMEHIEPQIRQDLPACSYCVPLAAPSNLQAVDNGLNRVDLTWDPVPGAVTYQILRSDSGCAGQLNVLNTTASTTWADTPVSGGTTYGYVVRPISSDLCFGTPSACVELTVTGSCILAPSFAGASGAVIDLSGNCRIDLDWAAATGRCSSDIVYNVYRDTTPGFTPGAANNIASCVGGIAYTDMSVVPGTRYFYQIRAEDRQGVGTGRCAGGSEETNGVELPAQAVSGTPVSDFADDAESPTSLLTLGTPWARNNTRFAQGAFSYRADGQTSFTCGALVTPPLVLTTSSVLSYAHFQDTIELDAGTVAWDGATVEISKDNGTTWTRLEPTPPYPNTFLAAANSCNNDRSGGGCYSGNSTAWNNATVDLSGWAGRDVLIRFVMATDDSAVSNFWYVDDIRITAVASNPCSSQNCVPLPSPVDRLLAVEAPTSDDVTFQWAAATAGFFRVNSVDLKTNLPAYTATGAVQRCSTPDGSTLLCSHTAALPGSPLGVLFYSVVGVCAADPSVEGP